MNIKKKQFFIDALLNSMLTMPEEVFFKFVRSYCEENYIDEQLINLYPILDDFENLVKSWQLPLKNN